MTDDNDGAVSARSVMLARALPTVSTATKEPRMTPDHNTRDAAAERIATLEAAVEAKEVGEAE